MSYTGWIGSFLVFVGLYLTGQKDKRGFLVGAVAEGFWLAYAFHLKSLPLGIMALIFILIYLWNYRKWSVAEPPQTRT